MGIRTQLEDIKNLLEETEPKGNVYFVDGTNGDDDYTGLDWEHAFATIQAAVDEASAHDTIYVAPKTITAGLTDPVSYAETIIIPVAKSHLKLIGVGNRTQGGLPQIKKGSGSTALLTVRAPGCLIANLGFNGGSSTGGGILLDANGTTKDAFGTTIFGCHFKNCAVNALDASYGGAIMIQSAWQIRIIGNRFYKNVGDIITFSAYSDPQDIIIEDNIFSGNAADTDCNIYAMAGGAGILGVTIRNNVFNQLPAIGSGVNKRYMKLTGCTGMVVDNVFGCQTSHTGGTKITFQAAGTGAFIPTTMHVARNFGQSILQNESGEITIAS